MGTNVLAIQKFHHRSKRWEFRQPGRRVWMVLKAPHQALRLTLPRVTHSECARREYAGRLCHYNRRFISGTLTGVRCGYSPLLHSIESGRW